MPFFAAGVDVCRMNFSHGELSWHLQLLRNIREAAARWDKPIAVLGDLCGPKIRLGKIADSNGSDGMPIAVGDELIIQRAAILGENGRVSSTYPSLVDDVQIGHRVLIEDGSLRFICTDKNFNEICCNCTMGGDPQEFQGRQSAGYDRQSPLHHRPRLGMRRLGHRERSRLSGIVIREIGRRSGTVREHLVNKVSDINLIAKIEKAEALDHIEAILEASDGLMIARGDLGVEMDVAEVPIIQKDLIRRCQTAGKPVIVATQMLQSMIEHSSPTRAEVSDVANAIFDGTDAVMLSGETSVGKFPLGSVNTMAHVAEVTEDYLVKSMTSPALSAKPGSSDAAAFGRRRPRRLADRQRSAGQTRRHLEPDRRHRAHLFQDALSRPPDCNVLRSSRPPANGRCITA